MDHRNFRVTKSFSAARIGGDLSERVIPAGEIIQVDDWITRDCFGLKTTRFQFKGQGYHAPASVVYDSLEEAN